MNLSRKGLFLVFVPFALTLLLCSVMVVAERAAEAELHKQAQERKVLSLANALPYHLLNLGADLIAWRATNKERFLRACDNETSLIKACVQQLTLQAQTSQDAPRIKQIADETSRLLGYVNDYRKNVSAADRVPGSFNRHTFSTRMQSGMGAMLTNIEELSSPDSEFDNALRLNYRNLFRGFDQLIVLSVLLSAAVAVLTGLTGARRLVGSIKTVEENFARQSRGETLLPELPPGDEVAQLDQSFHAMVNELAQAEREKKASRLVLNRKLRKPIDSLRDDLGLMLNGIFMEPTAKGEERIGRAIAGLDKLVCLIDELLDIDELRKAELSLITSQCETSTIVSGALDCVETVARKFEHELQDKSSGSFKLIADERKIEQVLINLLSNACKYSQAGEPIEVRCTSIGEVVRFEVKDKGKGLTPDQCSRVFERFEQAGDADFKKGIGLGLPICKKVIEQHGGKIGVVSKENEGSTFWFELPALA